MVPSFPQSSTIGDNQNKHATSQGEIGEHWLTMATIRVLVPVSCAPAPHLSNLIILKFFSITGDAVLFLLKRDPHRKFNLRVPAVVSDEC